jgi:plastocyanin
MFHCHINNHAANGMSTVLQYDGYQPVSSDAGHGSHGAMAPLPVGGTPGPAAPASGGAPAAAAGTPIVMLDNHYAPGRLTLPAGTTVMWINNGINFHTVTSFDALWDSGTLDYGKTFTYTFTQPGTYRYYCRQHLLQGMTGTITVTPP